MNIVTMNFLCMSYTSYINEEGDLLKERAEGINVMVHWISISTSNSPRFSNDWNN